jgi:hypothetical protein
MERKDKKAIEKQLTDIKKKLSVLSDQAKDKQVIDAAKSQNINANMFSLIKYMIDENKRTTMLLESINNTISKLENELKEATDDEEREDAASSPIQHRAEAQQAKEIILPDTDIKILQLIQLSHSNMASAEEVQQKLGYKGKNAACSRLNRLYKLGVLERHQVGHKVYYKYDAGKTNLFIISPTN